MIIPESVPNSPEGETVDVSPVISPPNVHFRQLFTQIDYYHEPGGDREICDSWKNDKDEGIRKCQYYWDIFDSWQDDKDAGTTREDGRILETRQFYIPTHFNPFALLPEVQESSCTSGSWAKGLK